MQLKSLLFRASYLSDDAVKIFKADMNELLEAEESTLSLVYEALADSELENNAGLLVANISDKSGVSRTIVPKILNAARYWLYASLKDDVKSDSIDDWLDDLIELGLIERARREKLNNIISKIRNDIAPAAETMSLKSTAETGVLPYYRSIDTSVELRAIKRNEYSSNDDIESYKPDIVGSVGIVSIRLVLDEADLGNVHFQIGRSHLNRMINKLKAALKDLDALERSIVKMDDD